MVGVRHCVTRRSEGAKINHGESLDETVERAGVGFPGRKAQAKGRPDGVTTNGGSRAASRRKMLPMMQPLVEYDFGKGRE